MPIFLDLDGTLVDVAPRHYRVYKRVVDGFGGKPLAFEDYWPKKRQKVPWETLIAESGLSLEKDVFLAPFIELIESQEELRADQLFPMTLELLTKLAKHDDLYLLTLRRRQEPLEYQLEQLGLKPFFKKILFGHTDAEGYQKKVELARSVGANGTIAWIGDTEADILAAQEIGATVYAVKSGIRDEKFLDELKPDHLVDSFADAAKHWLGKRPT